MSFIFAAGYLRKEHFPLATIVLMAIWGAGRAGGQSEPTENILEALEPNALTIPISKAILVTLGVVKAQPGDGQFNVGDFALPLYFEDIHLNDEFKALVESDLEFVYQDSTSVTTYDLSGGKISNKKLAFKDPGRKAPSNIHSDFGFVVNTNNRDFVVVSKKLTDEYKASLKEVIARQKDLLLLVHAYQKLFTLDAATVGIGNLNQQFEIVTINKLSLEERVEALKLLATFKKFGPSLFDLRTLKFQKKAFFSAQFPVYSPKYKDSMMFYFIFSEDEWKLLIPNI